MLRSKRILGLAACGWLALLGFAQAQSEPENILARDLTIGQRPIYQFVQQHHAEQAQRPTSQRVAVEAWTDRADSSFRIGDPVTINVRPQHDAYITVLNVGTSGRTTILFPNRMQRESRVRAGQVLTLGGPGAGYSIAPQGPTGIELVEVVATSRPLTLPELNQLTGQPSASPFLSMGRSAEEVTRDLAMQVTGPQAMAAGPNGMATLMIRVVDQPAVSPVAAGQPAQLLAMLQQLGVPTATQPVPAPTPSAVAPVADPALTLPVGFAPPPIVIRTDRSVYQGSDPVQITVAALADCRMTLLSVGPTGNVAQLFPNPAQTEAQLRAGQVIMVPPPSSNVAIRPRGPSGMETIIGLCAEPAAALVLATQRDLGAVTQAVTTPTAAATGVATAATVYFVRQ